MTSPMPFISKRQPLNARRGFSLIELLLAIAVLSIASTGIVVVFNDFSRSVLVNNVEVDIRQTLRSGMDFMAREIQQAGLDPTRAAGAGIEVAQSTRLRFSRNLWDDSKTINNRVARENEEQISYFFDDDKRTLYRALYENIHGDGLPASIQPLIDDIADCEFAYFGRDGVFLGTNSIETSDIRSIEIRLRLDKPAARYGTLSREMRTRVFCRNL